MRRLNVKLLGGLVLGTVLLVGLLFLVHWLQTGRIARDLLARADRAEQESQQPDKVQQAIKLKDATRFLSRYLELQRDDLGVRARLGKLLADERLAVNSRSRSHALFVLEQILVKDPEAHELRFTLVRLALELRRLDLAREHLAALVQARPDDAEVAYQRGLLAEADNDWAAAALAYRRTVELAPAKVEAYVRWSDILRRRLGSENAERNQQEADEVMNQLADNNVDQASALLARWRYRRQWHGLNTDAGKLEEAAADVRRVLELQPNEPETLLAAADLFQLEKKPDEARRLLNQGRQAHPREVRFIRDLAGLELREGRRGQAIACLNEGMQTLPDDASADLLWTLANIHLDARQVDEAEKTIAKLVKNNQSSPAAVDYLTARVCILQSRWLEAARLLERRRDMLASSPEFARQADLLLAQCHERTNEPDMQLADFGRLVARDPSSVQGRLGLASAFLALGRHADALEQYRRVVQLPGAPPAASIELARLVLVRNLQRPKPDWEEIEPLIERAEQRNPDSLDVQLLRAEVLASRQRLDEARTCLSEAGRKHPERFEPWLALAELAERQSQPEEVQRCLAEAEKLGAGNVEAQAALVRFWSRRRGPDGDAALARTVAALDPLEPGPQARLLTELAQAYFRRGKLDEAAQFWERLSRFPDNRYDVRLRLILFEVALQRGDDPAMQRYLKELQGIEGNQGCFYRYGTALRLIRQARQGNKTGLEEARNLLDAVSADRPAWSAVLLAKADIESLRDNSEQAIVHYRKAVELGERNPRVVRQLVQLLYRQQRYDEAEQEIRRLQRQAPTPELQRLIVDIALRKQDPLQAAQEALDAVAADSNDYRDHVWLGQVLALTGQQPEQAEKHLRKAIELGPGEPETWLALVQFLASNGRRPEAVEAIGQAKAKIAAERAPLALAQCHEAIGNLKSAEEQYQAFLTAAPDDVMRLRSVAAFYLRIGRVSLAEPLLRKLMEQTKNETEAAWARRSLAMALASAGDQRRMIEAQQLVGSGSEDPVELRARARILAKLPLRSQRAQAIKLLEDLAQKQTLPVDDQFLLAQLYQDSGVWPKARDILRELTTHGHHPQHLSVFANGLLKHNQLADADRIIERLEKLEKDRQLPAGSTIELRLQLLEAKGQGEQALVLARKFVAEDAKRPGRILVWLATLVRQKRFQDVLTFWNKAKHDGPPELISGAVVASLRGGQMNPEQCAPVQAWMEAALEKNPKALGLMLQLADLHDLCGRYPDAEAVYRRVLAVDADNVVALNNLAWLLAQQAGKGDEALPLISRAIDRAGSRAELLDTRASVYLALRQTEKAIADLESANADQPTASRYFLLAQAQRQANNTQRAADLLRRATAAGLKAEQLHPAERNAFLKLQQELEQR